jgi:hypothetical protein
MLLEQVTEGVPDDVCLEQVCCYLIQERLEGVKVVLVDEKDVGVDVLELLRRSDAGEAPTEHDDTRPRRLGAVRHERSR